MRHIVEKFRKYIFRTFFWLKIRILDKKSLFATLPKTKQKASESIGKSFTFEFGGIPNHISLISSYLQTPPMKTVFHVHPTKANNILLIFCSLKLFHNEIQI